MFIKLNKLEELLHQINKQLEEVPLIYFAREVDRALGLDQLLKNYHVACIEKNQIANMLRDGGINTFVLEENVRNEMESKSVANLISEPKTVEWINNITNKGKFYALTLYPTEAFKYKVESLGGKLIASNLDTARKLEDKIEFFNQIKKITDIVTPKTLIFDPGKVEYSTLEKELGRGFIIQLARSHTGGGSFRIEDKEIYAKIKAQFAGNLLKASEFIEGTSFTLNGLIAKDQFLFGPLQYQITGIPELTRSPLTTVGNDFSFGAQLLEQNEIFKANLEKLTTSVAKYLVTISYTGVFGVDLVSKDNKIYLIEVNARQTLNLPFQTQIELSSSITPMYLLHIAQFLGINIEDHLKSYRNFPKLHGAQVFLRSDSQTKIKHEFKTGIYRLQSDNTSTNFEDRTHIDNVIFLDEDEDKPLIFKKEAYNLMANQDEGFLIMFQAEGVSKKITEEICRMQFKEGIMLGTKPKPWIMEALKSIKHQIC